MIFRAMILLTVLTSCATTKHSADPRELAIKLVKITSVDAEKTARITTRTAMAPLVQGLKDQGYSSETIVEVNHIIDEFIDKFINDPTLNSQVVDLYVGEFTVEELQAMLDFYQLPVGKKTLEKTPVIMQKSVDIGLVLAQKHQGEFVRKIDEVLKNSNCSKCKEQP